MIARTLVVTFALISASAPLARAQSADVIESSVTIAASPDAVWRAWTTKDGIESWMTAKTDIDLRVGGTWRTSYDRNSTLDDDPAIHHLILALDPGRMLAFRTVKSPKAFPFAAAIARTWTVVYFEANGGNRTTVTVRMLGYGDDPELVKMRSFFEQGNTATLASLAKKFSAGAR